MSDVFDTYDTRMLSAYYESKVEASQVAAAWMQRKYEMLATRVSALAESDCGMDVYAGPITQERHQFLFGLLLRAISVESCMLAVLAVLYLTGYETQARTELAVCATKKGRRLWRTKAFAGIISALLMYLLLAALSLVVYFALWDYRGIWSANVSSGFNYIRDLLMIKPFITWTDFTCVGCLAASPAFIAALLFMFDFLAP